MKNPDAPAVKRKPKRIGLNMDVLKRFPRVWCPTCDKTQPMIFDVMKANDKNDHDAADIVCAECKSIIATLHAPSAHWAGGRTKIGPKDDGTYVQDGRRRGASDLNPRTEAAVIRHFQERAYGLFVPEVEDDCRCL